MPVCPRSCQKKCFQNVDIINRKHIFETFVNYSFCERRLFLDKYVIEKTVSQRRSSAVDLRKRNRTINYYLPASKTGERVLVCKIMFLHTISRTSDSIVMEHLSAKSRNQAGRINVAKQQKRKRNRNKLHSKTRFKNLLKVTIQLFRITNLHMRQIEDISLRI